MLTSSSSVYSSIWTTAADYSKSLTALAMGSIVSTLQGTLFTLSAAIKALSSLNTQFSSLLKRIVLPPGYPVDNPTSSYWLDNPPFPHLCDVQGTLEAETDVVIIGSGITSASIAKSLLELSEKDDTPLRVTVLEARQLSSGATGRNGGHIKSTPYEMFCFYKKRVGPERARDFIRFQMRHLPTLIEVGEKFPLGEAREVQTVDLFLEEEDFEKAKMQADEAKQWLPEIEHTVWGADEARKEVGAHPTSGAQLTVNSLVPTIPSLVRFLTRPVPSGHIALLRAFGMTCSSDIPT
jgi:hypothetical protein